MRKTRQRNRPARLPALWLNGRRNKDCGRKMNYLLVILSSAIGSGLRYWLSNIVQKNLSVTAGNTLTLFPFNSMSFLNSIFKEFMPLCHIFYHQFCHFKIEIGFSLPEF
jgi:hypothetical protein